MQPYIMDKSLVVADLSQKEFKNEDIFLIYKDDNMWIKKAKTKNNEDFFVSINPNYSHLQYIRNDCRIIAKVILFFENNVKKSD